jgi:hypothetical protein
MEALAGHRGKTGHGDDGIRSGDRPPYSSDPERVARTASSVTCRLNSEATVPRSLYRCLQPLRSMRHAENG